MSLVNCTSNLRLRLDRTFLLLASWHSLEYGHVLYLLPALSLLRQIEIGTCHPCADAYKPLNYHSLSPLLQLRNVLSALRNANFGFAWGASLLWSEPRWW